MSSQPAAIFRRFFRTTRFWKDNALILREFRYFPGIAVASIVFPIIAAILEGFGIGFLLGFLQNLVNGAEPFQVGIRWFDVHVLGINEPELNRLYRVCALILLTAWLRAYFNYLTFTSMEIAKVRLYDRLYKRIFEQLQSLNLAFFSKVRAGEIINTLTAEISQLQIVVNSFSFIIQKGFSVLVYAAIALIFSWQLCLMATVLFSLAVVGLSTLNKRVREASFPVSTARGQFTSIASELINGIRTVQAFATQDFERQRYYKASDNIVNTATVAAKQLSLVKPLAEGIATTILVGMIVVGLAVLVANDILEVASLLTFMFVLFRLVPALQELNQSTAQISSLQGSIHTIQELLRTDNKPYLQNGSVYFQGLKKSIDLVSVDFGYDLESPILRNITLSIQRGETIALVGASGAGKSTLADLIPRFYDPTKGKILFDGIDLREFDINSVRRRIAIVSQDTFIFNATIRANIAYGLENVDDETVLNAAKAANALDFIHDLPEGLDTVLGDRGVRLSGGQRQRIAIARALLRDPEILILDEATSALDSVSERLIQASIEQISVGRTVIAIAHRLSTISRADKIIVLEEGQLVEQGTYQALVAQRGKLWKYHQMQYELSS